MAKLTVRTEQEKFGSRVTIAHLAQFSFEGLDSDYLTVYEVAAILERDWRWELEPGTMEIENGCGTRTMFKDGSELSVGAWADCCDGNGYCPQCRNGITRFNPRQSEAA